MNYSHPPFSEFNRTFEIAMCALLLFLHFYTHAHRLRCVSSVIKMDDDDKGDDDDDNNKSSRSFISQHRNIGQLMNNVSK